MEMRKIALIASILVLPSQSLLAASANQGAAVQTAGTETAIAAPGTTNNAAEPHIAGKSNTVPSTNAGITSNYKPTRLSTIQLRPHQRLRLTNGKSIIKNGHNGLHIIGVANSIESGYQNAALFKGDRQSVWIKANGKQNNVGIFSRIEVRGNVVSAKLSGAKANSESTPSTGRPTLRKASTATSNGKMAPAAQGKKSAKAGLSDYEQALDINVQGPDGDSTANVNAKPAKDVAGDFENSEGEPEKFKWFHVASDSVVATASVVVDENHRTLSINWGDGEVEKVNLRGMQSTINDEHATNQSNAFKFRHVYKAPLGETKKSVQISARNNSGRLVSLSATEVDINARYKFSMYSVILEFPDHLDSAVEQNSEVEGHMVVKQGGDVFYNRAWGPENIYTGGKIKFNWNLPNTHFSREIAHLDQHIEIDLNLAELDGIDGSGSGALEFAWDVITAPFEAAKWTYEALSQGFDPSNSLNLSGMPLKIHPDTTIGSNIADKATVIYEIGNREGRIIAHFSYDLKLIIPANPASGATPMNSIN